MLYVRVCHMVQVLLSPQSCELVHFSSTLLLKPPCHGKSYRKVIEDCQVASIKLIRNKQTGQSERYGFIEFHTHEAAEKVLQTYNGSMMPNTYQVFRLNWASFLVRLKVASMQQQYGQQQYPSQENIGPQR
ncbi:putative RNA recognition motif domain, nucleotide-binding alpha-beta plait domain superfamily [Helianthus annuus]|nr:putative RNA recognition motif domain, nucleotide-binding alpha-beta plait domain superfamily [Helianthus annuus]